MNIRFMKTTVHSSEYPLTDVNDDVDPLCRPYLISALTSRRLTLAAVLICFTLSAKKPTASFQIT